MDSSIVISHSRKRMLSTLPQIQLKSGDGMKPAYFLECARKYSESDPGNGHDEMFGRGVCRKVRCTCMFSGYGANLLLGLATAAAEVCSLQTCAADP